MNYTSPYGVLGVCSYDPFGMITLGRSWEVGSEYRYGFNGKESEDEIYGENNAVDFGARVYDARLGKWLSMDPVSKNNQALSSYNFVRNSPITRIDPDGKTDYDVRYIVEKNDQGNVIKVTAYVSIVYQVLDASSKMPVDDVNDLAVVLPDYNIQFESRGVTIDVKVDINFEFIKDVSQINDKKNVLMVVDEIKPDSDKRDLLGVAYLNGQAILIEYNSRNNLTTILHEMGHNLGLFFKGKLSNGHSDDPNHLMYGDGATSTKTNHNDFKTVFSYLAFKTESGNEHVTDANNGSNAKYEILDLFKTKALKFNKQKANNAGIK